MGTKAGRKQWVPHKGWENQGLHHLHSTIAMAKQGSSSLPIPPSGTESSSLPMPEPRFLSISVPAPGLGSQKYLTYL